MLDKDARIAELELFLAKKDAALRGVENFARQIATHFPQSAQTLLEITDLALAPAAQGETKPYGDGWHADLDFDDLVRAAAAAPSAGAMTCDECGGTGKTLIGAAECWCPVCRIAASTFRDPLSWASKDTPDPTPAPAPSAGETRAAIIEECAKVAESHPPTYDRYPVAIAAAIRALAAAPTTGEPNKYTGRIEKLEEILGLARAYIDDASPDWHLAKLDMLSVIDANLAPPTPTTGEPT